jgi:rod shape-determining protein MreD
MGKRTALIAITSLILLLIQSSVTYSASFTYREVKPDIFFIFLILISIKFGLYPAYYCGAAGGFFTDIISVGRMGVYTLSFFLGCSFAGLFQKKIIFSKAPAVFLVFFTALFIKNLTVLILAAVFDGIMPALYYFKKIMLLELVINSLVFPFLYYPIFILKYLPFLYLKIKRAVSSRMSKSGLN